MTAGASRQIESTRTKLDAGERGGSEADRELLLEFSDRLRLLGEEYTDDRHIKLLRHLMRVSEEVDGGDVLADAVARWSRVSGRVTDNPGPILVASGDIGLNRVMNNKTDYILGSCPKRKLIWAKMKTNF